MDNVRNPRGRLFYYVLLTRCAHCRKLKERGIEPFKPNCQDARYVVGIARSTIHHPISGQVTHKPGALILIKEGTLFTVFDCPHHVQLTFVTRRSFARDCEGYDPHERHHGMPDGKWVESK